MSGNDVKKSTQIQADFFVLDSNPMFISTKVLVSIHWANCLQLKFYTLLYTRWALLIGRAINDN